MTTARSGQAPSALTTAGAADYALRPPPQTMIAQGDLAERQRNALGAKARWMSLCTRWVASRLRRARCGPRPWVDTLGAERRAARLLRHWASCPRRGGRS